MEDFYTRGRSKKVRRVRKGKDTVTRSKQEKLIEKMLKKWYLIIRKRRR